MSFWDFRFRGRASRVASRRVLRSIDDNGFGLWSPRSEPDSPVAEEVVAPREFEHNQQPDEVANPVEVALEEQAGEPVGEVGAAEVAMGEPVVEDEHEHVEIQGVPFVDAPGADVPDAVDEHRSETDVDQWYVEGNGLFNAEHGEFKVWTMYHTIDIGRRLVTVRDYGRVVIRRPLASAFYKAAPVSTDTPAPTPTPVAVKPIYHPTRKPGFSINFGVQDGIALKVRAAEAVAALVAVGTNGEDDVKYSASLSVVDRIKNFLVGRSHSVRHRAANKFHKRVRQLRELRDEMIFLGVAHKRIKTPLNEAAAHELARRIVKDAADRGEVAAGDRRWFCGALVESFFVRDDDDQFFAALGAAMAPVTA